MKILFFILLLLTAPASAQTSGCIAQAGNCPKPVQAPR